MNKKAAIKASLALIVVLGFVVLSVIKPFIAMGVLVVGLVVLLWWLFYNTFKLKG